MWVWTQEDPERLGPRTKRVLVGAENVTCVCPISTLEIARLVAAGDIELSMPLSDWVMQSMSGLSAQTVSLSHEVALEAYALPGAFHRDPADRLLVAAARLNGLTMISADERILAYPHLRTHDARR